MRAFRFLTALLAATLAVLAFANDRPDRRGDDRRDNDRRDNDRRDNDRRDNDRHQRRPRVFFYEHADFRGTFFVLEAGEQMSNLARQLFQNGIRANDRVSSIRIEGDAEVLLFRHGNFQGGPLRLDHSVHNLTQLPGGWNDVISSVRVERERRGPSAGPR